MTGGRRRDGQGLASPHGHIGARPALLKERESDTRLSSHPILNKCFVSAPSLLFITNKYLSTESLAPRCFTVIHYFCHLVVLFLSSSSSPLFQPLPLVTSVTERSRALQLSSVLGASWWLVPVCQDSPPGVPHSLPSPEASPRQDNRARGFFSFVCVLSALAAKQKFKKVSTSPACLHMQ